MDFRPNLHGLCLIAGLKNDWLLFGVGLSLIYKRQKQNKIDILLWVIYVNCIWFVVFSKLYFNRALT